MTASAKPPPDGARFSDILEGLGRGDRERLYVREVLDAFGEQGLGAIMLIFALFSCLPLPPGGSTLTGAPLLLLSLELATLRDTLWLPRRFVSASVKRESLRKGFGWMIPVVRFAENLSRPRLLMLTGRFGQGLIGVTCFLLSIVLVLPIPLGNIAPAATIALFSLGVMQRDGVAVILGWTGVAISVGLLAIAWRVVAHAVGGLYDQLTSLHLVIP
ncbi:MAG: exopolysaccharide biosynthesis protein [Caulobacteraceae bacterium]|nr:exopolysaccharide biosynthesis protein [Caulobacteraceae bacterium]